MAAVASPAQVPGNGARQNKKGGLEMRKNVLFSSIVFFTLFTLVLGGCGKKAEDQGRVIAKVNGEPVYSQEVNQVIAWSLKVNPQFKITPEVLDDQLNVIIDRKILLQQALKKKLDQTEEFTKAMEAFREQALIRALVDAKGKEAEPSISVSDKQVEDYYNVLTHKKTFQTIKSKIKTYITELSAKNPDEIKWEDTIGPIRYDQIPPGVLKSAFSMPKGEMKVFKGANDMYFLIYVKDDVEESIGSFDEVKDAVRQRLVSMEKQKRFQEWFTGVREKSKIKINKDLLQKETAKETGR